MEKTLFGFFIVPREKETSLRSLEPGVGDIDFFAFDTHATNSIPMCSAEYADHNGAIGTLNTQRIAYKCPSEVTTFFHSLRAQAQRVPHKADS